MPPQDRDIHLVELKICSDVNPYITLKTAATRHAYTITRLKNRRSRNINRNMRMAKSSEHATGPFMASAFR
eukprot:548595-Pelagomonas_calceolata.AAC.1